MISPTTISSNNELLAAFLRIKSTVSGFFNSFPFIKDFGSAFFDSENPNVQFHSAVTSEQTTPFYLSLSSHCIYQNYLPPVLILQFLKFFRAIETRDITDFCNETNYLLFICLLFQATYPYT